MKSIENIQIFIEKYIMKTTVISINFLIINDIYFIFFFLIDKVLGLRFLFSRKYRICSNNLTFDN